MSDALTTSDALADLEMRIERIETFLSAMVIRGDYQPAFDHGLRETTEARAILREIRQEVREAQNARP